MRHFAGWFDSTAGSTDVDAAIVTLSGLPKDAIAAPIAALAIGGTVAVNMAFKIAIAGVTARRKALPAMAALGASLAVLLATLALKAAGFG